MKTDTVHEKPERKEEAIGGSRWKKNGTAVVTEKLPGIVKKVTELKSVVSLDGNASPTPSRRRKQQNVTNKQKSNTAKEAGQGLAVPRKH